MKKLKNILSALLYLALFFAIQFAVVFIFELAVTLKETVLLAASGDVDTAALTEAVVASIKENEIALTVVSDVLFVLVVWLIFKIRKKSMFAEVGLTKPNFRYLPAVIALGATANVIVSLIFTFLPLPESWWEEYNTASAALDEISVVNVIAIVVVAPIAEELLFRGLVFTRLSRGLGVYIGAAASALLFGLVHGTVIWGIYTALFGLVIVFILVRTRSLFYAMMFHFAFNAFSFFVEDISFVMVAVSVPLFVAAAADLIITSNRLNRPAPPPDTPAPTDEQ